MLSSETFTTLISILLTSSATTAIVNYFLNKTKTKQELEKLRQETGLVHVSSLGEVITILRGELDFYVKEVQSERSRRKELEQEVLTLSLRLDDCLTKVRRKDKNERL